MKAMTWRSTLAFSTAGGLLVWAVFLLGAQMHGAVLWPFFLPLLVAPFSDRPARLQAVCLALIPGVSFWVAKSLVPPDDFPALGRVCAVVGIALIAYAVIVGRREVRRPTSAINGRSAAPPTADRQPRWSGS